MTHEELRDLYELYALGALDTEEKAEIEEHLARGCVECKAGVKSALGLTTFLATIPERVEPPRQLRQKLVVAVGGADVPRRAWLWTWAAATAALAVVAVMFWTDANRERQDLADARRQVAASSAEVSRVHDALQLLNEPDTEQVTFGKGPRGRVFVSPRRGVLFTASNLPPAAAGKTYEMWVVPKSGAPKPAGLFQSDAQGNALHILAGPVDRATTAAIAISVEPQAGSSAPTTTPIIVAGLSD